LASFRRVRRALGVAASAVDRAMLAAMDLASARDRALAVGIPHAERLAILAEIEAEYATDAIVADPTRFFPPPRAIDPSLRRVRTGSPPRTEVIDASWPSTFEPFGAQVAERYLAVVDNRTAHARLVQGARSGQPAIIAVHGYLGGRWLLEEASWPVAWLARRGLDVALPVLPFHAQRAGARRGGPPFPGADPRMTNEGFRQTVADLGALARWLRERGAPQVGVVGMSLGGYAAALMATVASGIDFVMPMIPLASVADFARDQGRLGGPHEVTEQHAALERANRVVSPLARPLVLPPSRVLVVAAEHDRVTPAAHAQRLAAHFACELVTFPGGHLVQVGRADAFRGLARMLEREGIIAPRKDPRRGR